jgi:hypothetical protein
MQKKGQLQETRNITTRDHGYVPQVLWKSSNRPLVLCKMMHAIIHRSITNSTQIEARIKAKNSHGGNRGGQVSNLDIAIAQAEVMTATKSVDEHIGQLVDAIGALMFFVCLCFCAVLLCVCMYVSS